MQTNNRTSYIDAMRGLAMLMVVIGHCCNGSFGVCPVFASDVTIPLQIPLFFMVSGFFAPSLLKRPLWETIAKKFMQLVVPTLAIMIIYVWIFRYNFWEVLREHYKLGFWFTFVLFGFCMLYMAINFFLHKLKISYASGCIANIVIALAVAYGAIIVTHINIPDSIVGLLSVSEYYNYPYFVIGAVLYSNRNALYQLFKNQYVIGGGTAFYTLGQIAVSKYGVDDLGYFAALFDISLHLSGLLLIWQLFLRYPSLSIDTRCGRWLTLIGQRSIDVYFLHYFFLPRLPLWGQYLEHLNSPFITFLCAIALSVPLIAVSLGTGVIIRQSAVTARLLLGVADKTAASTTNQIIQ